ncbi:Ion channel regulatory protein [Aphelenchoides avenae]|nr:Ion channel regulatory protein [Aphelenchus avenae]
MDPQLLNVLLMSVAFFFLLLAYVPAMSIEQTVIDSYADRGVISRYAGYYSQAIIYGVFTFANFFAPPIAICMGSKWSMFIASMPTLSSRDAFSFSTKQFSTYFLFSSLAELVYNRESFLWSAQGKFLSDNSRQSEEARNAGIFWAVSQISTSLGGVFLLVAFAVMGDATTISDSSAKVLYGGFFGVSLLCTLTLSLLRAPPKSSAMSDHEAEKKEHKPGMSYWQLQLSTLKLLADKPMLLMSVVFAVSGYKMSFKNGIFPTAIAFTLRMDGNPKTVLALSSIIGGVGQSTAGTIVGMLNRRNWASRGAIVAFGTTILLVCFAFIYVSFPRLSSLQKTDDVGIIDPNVPLILVMSFVLGLGDGAWNTQMFTFIVAHYKERSAQGFSIMMFWQSLLACAAFFYSSLFDLYWHIYILSAGTVLGAACYYAADIMVLKREPAAVDDSPHEDDDVVESHL